MAHHKSALKRIRQTRTRKIYNRLNKKQMKEALKAVRSCKAFEEGVEKLTSAMRTLDRVAAHGVIHKNTASRYKSRLSKFVSNLKAA